MVNVDDFSARLIEQMDRCKLDVKELAEIIGCDKHRIYDWRHGKALPQLYYFEGMCKAFGVSADFMLTGKEYKA